VAGFVLNKFRGDVELLTPGPAMLEELTGVRTLGVLPWLEHGLPDEDGAAEARSNRAGRSTVAVIRYPTASNLDEFKPLEDAVDLRWVERPEHIDGSGMVILPGSKNVAADLAWLRRQGLAAAIRERGHRDEPILGICGGLQMLGQCLEDEAGVDGSAQGLGILPLRTGFRAAKKVTRTTVRFNALGGSWRALSGESFAGYEIRHGESTMAAPVEEALPDGLGFVQGSVLGIYVHGMFEEPRVVRRLFDVEPRRSLDDVFDGLADAVEERLDVAHLVRLATAR
jgi:adenosylcobyric acid synthase